MSSLLSSFGPICRLNPTFWKDFSTGSRDELFGKQTREQWLNWQAGRNAQLLAWNKSCFITVRHFHCNTLTNILAENSGLKQSDQSTDDFFFSVPRRIKKWRFSKTPGNLQTEWNIFLPSSNLPEWTTKVGACYYRLCLSSKHLWKVVSLIFV